MSRYATKWEPCTSFDYFTIYNAEELGVYSSFTSPDGCELSFSPRMMTTWGNDEKELIRSEATKDGRWEGEGFDLRPWEYKYWLAVEWDEDE